MFLLVGNNQESKKNKPPNEGNDDLLSKYYYLIEEIAGNFKDVSESQETLAEVGYIGLLNAVNLYEQRKPSLNFKSYAQLMITREIHHYLLDQTYEIEQPPWLGKINQKINEFVISYQRQYQRSPALSELADHFNLTEIALQEVLKGRKALKESYLTFQLEEQWNEIQPDLAKIRSKSYQHFKLPIQDVITLQKALLKLKKLQRSIIYYLFIMDLRQSKMAQKLGLSEEAINKQMKNNLLLFFLCSQCTLTIYQKEVPTGVKKSVSLK
jgi:RNA polymerase sigma-B factor